MSEGLKRGYWVNGTFFPNKRELNKHHAETELRRFWDDALSVAFSDQETITLEDVVDRVVEVSKAAPKVASDLNAPFIPPGTRRKYRKRKNLANPE